MKIVQVDDKVKIGDFEFYGHIAQKQWCSNCKANLVYYEEFDAYFCPECNEWTESKCSDPNCKYCPNRPYKPF
ncbi:hypothetical protein [Lysinibacillus sp. SGAir0095]|uniref:hypothetical protein n=1 Tax=Lysinibacillus sp. SGAir0095 TaxID=2070463 RepID=UPI0010CD3E01|nr:hypothetical protein [Lysinibacillus sp. SGAir0095]QCR33096.1 hypothetical protein C1N55_13310 [Lysinibacillus sp. SGAir0095]